MGAEKIIAAVREAGVNLMVNGGRLIATPASALTDELRGLIRAHKAEIVALIALPANVERRINRMVRDGAIDDDDAALVRRRFHAYPAEWLLVLDACEAAAEQRPPEPAGCRRHPRKD